jgi:hypothetical protein
MLKILATYKLYNNDVKNNGIYLYPISHGKITYDILFILVMKNLIIIHCSHPTSAQNKKSQ